MQEEGHPSRIDGWRNHLLGPALDLGPEGVRLAPGGAPVHALEQFEELRASLRGVPRKAGYRDALRPIMLTL